MDHRQITTYWKESKKESLGGDVHVWMWCLGAKLVVNQGTNKGTIVASKIPMSTI